MRFKDKNMTVLQSTMEIENIILWHTKVVRGTNNNMLDKLKPVSIRGRMAFGLNCLEYALMKLNCYSKGWELVLCQLWKFTNADDLKAWAEETTEYLPDNILAFDRYHENEFKFIGQREFHCLRNMYDAADENLLEIVVNLYMIGFSNSKGRPVRNYDMNSIHILTQISKFLEKNFVTFPIVTDYLWYSFDENAGIGKKFNGTDLSRILNRVWIFDYDGTGQI